MCGTQRSGQRVGGKQKSGHIPPVGSDIANLTQLAYRRIIQSSSHGVAT